MQNTSAVPAFANPNTQAAPTYAVFEIPTLPVIPSRRQVSLGGTTYALVTNWCDPMQAWTLEIDDIDGNRILSGVPLVTGGDLLAQYGYLGLPGLLIAQCDWDYQTPPSLDNLGTTGHLYYLQPS